jgi:hypothetical protein
MIAGADCLSVAGEDNGEEYRLRTSTVSKPIRFELCVWSRDPGEGGTDGSADPD